jgi:ketopantoate reductase
VACPREFSHEMERPPADTTALGQIAEKLVKAGLGCRVTARLGHEIRVQLVGNVAFNPISAVTRATLVDMVRDPDVGALVRNIMIEVEAVANKFGVELPVAIDQWTVGAAIESGDRMELPCRTRSVYACTKLLDVVSRGGLK